MNNSIYPCVWCNNNANEMAKFYCNIFPESKIINSHRFIEMLEISGQKLMLLNGGDVFRPNSAISLMYLTLNENEVAELWGKLSDGGESVMPLGVYPFSPKYGWVTDKYGVSWQLYTAKEANHIIQKLVPTLMFTGTHNGKAEQAANFYTSLFPRSSMRGILKYPAMEDEIAGNVQHGEFIINDYLLMMMDSSKVSVEFSEGLSLVVECDTQEEIDNYWYTLTSNGGAESMCGWLKDQFGVSWQIIPRKLEEWMPLSPKVSEALLQMKKIDIDILKKAATE